MKYNTIKKYMDMTDINEDIDKNITKRYVTKHDREISKDEMGSHPDSKVELDFSGEESRLATIALRSLHDAKKAKKEAVIVIEQNQKMLFQLADKYTDELDRASAILLKSKSIHGTITKAVPNKEQTDYIKLYENLIKAYGELTGAFEAIKAVSTKKGGGRKRSIRTDTIKEEGVNDFIRRAVALSKINRAALSKINHAKSIVDELALDIASFSDDVVLGAEEMMRDPDYHRK